jgi:hypothetical protein
MFTIGPVFDARSIDALAESVRKAFGSVQAQIATTWNIQHKADGSHGDVTAARVRAGQLGGSGWEVANLGTAETLAPLQIPENVTLVTIRTPAAGTDLYGIQQPGAQYGDILAVSGDMHNAVELRLHHLANISPGPGTVPIGTEIGWDALFFGTNPLVLDQVSARSPLLLMYLPFIGAQRAAGWGILRGLTP